jgi:serine/threonine protein kinase
MPGLPEVGDEFAGYLLQSVIGRGAMSVVYEAEHPRLGSGIALKVLAAEVAADDIFRTRFLDESRIAASMNHPNVIPSYDVGESDGLLYIAMRRASGGSLRQRIAAGGPLPPLTAVALLSQATRALDAAHRLGLVHRNVKPENLLLDEADEAGAEHLYLADFGISRLGMERNGLTATGRFLGTTDYVAPEQLTEPHVYGSADQYSLGCVLFECLTGRVPPAPADLPPAVDELFARVLAERPGDRYNTCREFMEAAGVALADMAAAPLPAVESPAPEPVPEPEPEPESEPAPELVPKPQPAWVPLPGTGPGRRTRWLAIAAVLLLICAGGAGAYAALSPQPKASASTSPATPSAAPSTPTPRPTPVSPLAQVLAAADASKVAMGMLPSSSCQQQDAAMVVCSAPSPAIASATFTVYPTRAALFAAYKAEVRLLNHGRFRQNVKNCGLSAPSPYGEIAWNHREKHSRSYTIAEMTAGKVPVETAMGRMACLATAGHSEDIVWTTDYGKMLGVAIGSGSHKRVWLWWVAVHHNIVFPGTPMSMGGTAPLMSGAPMPSTSAAASPSMMASASPTMMASPSPSMSKAVR